MMLDVIAGALLSALLLPPAAAVPPAARPVQLGEPTDPVREIKTMLLPRCAAWGQYQARAVWGPGVTPPPRMTQQNADRLGFDCYAGQARAADWLADMVDMGTLSRARLLVCVEQERTRPLAQLVEANGTFGRIKQCADPSH